MHAIFIRNFGNIHANNICYMILAFLKHGHPLKELNKHIITLIRKKNNPKKVHYNRPISLYNVSYKFILKLLAHRLRIVLSNCLASSECFYSE